MPAFKDAKGRSWEVVVSTTTVARIRDLLKIDPLDVADRESKLLDQLAEDPVLLVNMLYVTVKPEADRTGVTDEEFGRAIFGASLYDATSAFLEALADFFRDPATRLAMKEVLKRLAVVEGRMEKLVEKQIASGAMDRKVESLIASAEKKFGESFGDLPGNSGSIPAR